ncbi:MAG: TonB C-terminal domain-containing protein [Cyanobacteria bacterium HKST-UBA01]|nr:TonB C-terminal domain-containing protein [Cyanobacteria bacterium HKST-UBA01]
MFDMRRMVSLILSLLLTAVFSQLSIASVIAPKRPDLDRLRNNVYKDWAPSKKLTNSTAIDIKVRVTANGQLYDVALNESSGDRQLDADCIQAVMGASCLSPINIRIEEIEQFSIHFDSKTEIGYQTDGISKFFAKHPKYRKNYIAFYRIPLTVLKRYPGVFTEEELFDESNVGLIESIDPHNPELPSWVADRLRFLYQGNWVPFFVSNPSATKDEIIEFRKKHIIDDKQLWDGSRRN